MNIEIHTEVWMFSGIVQEVGTIKTLNQKNNVQTIEVNCSENFSRDLKIGDSIAVDGVCLTVVKIGKHLVSFEVIEESVNRSIIAEYQEGTRVNLENSLKYGGSVGGHLCSGHVHSKGQIKEVELNGDSKNMLIEIDKQWAKYVLEKGYICINGCSLTIGKIKGNNFNIHLIPETLRATNLNELLFGKYVNIEIDQSTVAVVDTTERLARGK